LLLACLVLTLAASADAQGIKIAEGITLTPGEGWKNLPPDGGDPAILSLRGADGRTAGRAVVSFSVWRTAGDAVAQLARSVPASAGTPTAHTVAGRPAVTFIRQVEQDDPEEDEEKGGGGRGRTQPYTLVTTLVAADKLLLQFSVTLDARPGPVALKRARSLADGLRFSKRASATQTGKDLRAVRVALRARAAPARAMLLAGRRGGLAVLERHTLTMEPSAPVGVGAGRELEIAVSPDALDVVIVSNHSSIFKSNSGGTAFDAAVNYPTPAPTPDFERRSDLSTARAPSGRFYVSFLGHEILSGGTERDTVSLAVSEPGDRGGNFSFLSHAVRCAGDRRFFTTDQPHIAVDPRTRGGNSPDQIYVVWRKNIPRDDSFRCDGPDSADDEMLGFDTMVTCSVDGGQTWAHTRRVTPFNMYPRVTAGHDGMVYVVWEDARQNANIFLSKFSSCEEGLNLQDGFQNAVTPFTGVPRVPGLDRNNNGNILASPTVAVDSSNPRHVFIAYADRTSAGNEDIVVLGSADGGETWRLRTTANAPNVPGRRFMPWLCAAREQLFVSWYDRRDATAAAPDLTRYYVSLVRPRMSGNVTYELLRGIETSVSPVPDAQCRIWPRSPRNANDSDSCVPQPRAAGRCCVPDAEGNCDASSTRNACDFSDTPGVGTPPCAAREICMTGSGQPKYGDYTGNTCLDGSAFVTWTSTNNPADGTEFDAAHVYFARVNVVDTVTVTDLCPGAACGTALVGDTGDLVLQCLQDNCRMVVPVPEICQSALGCPGCGPGGMCLGDYTFRFSGLAAGWDVRAVDAQGAAVPGDVRRAGGALSITLRPDKTLAGAARLSRYTLVLERNGRGPRSVNSKLSVTASAP
jgi:hypothetical protein